MCDRPIEEILEELAAEVPQEEWDQVPADLTVREAILFSGDDDMKTAEEFYWEIHDEIKELHRKKGADYGTDSDPFANLRAAEDFGLEPWLGVALRMDDKMKRIKAFVRNGNLQNESLADSFIDLANYAMLGLALYREKHQA